MILAIGAREQTLQLRRYICKMSISLQLLAQCMILQPGLAAQSPAVIPAPNNQAATIDGSGSSKANGNTIRGTIALSPVKAECKNVEALDADIIGKEIDLIKLNTNLRLHVLPKSPWAQRRWFVYSLQNTVLTTIGAYMNGAGRFSYLKKSRIRRAPPYLYIDAGWCRAMANILSVAGASVEFALDRVSDYTDHRHGVDLPTMRRYAEKLKLELDSLLKQRESAVAAAPVSEEEKEAMIKEGIVLADLRSAALSDFVRWYSDAKGIRTSRNVQLFLTWLSNGNAGAGALVGIKSGHLKLATGRYKNRLGAVGGICDIVSGSVNWTTPITQRMAGLGERALVRHSMSEDLECDRQMQMERLKVDEATLQRHLQAHSELNVDRTILKTALLQQESDLISNHELFRFVDRRAAPHRLLGQMIPATETGPAKIANAITTCIGGFNYSRKAQPRFRVVGAGAMVYGSGYAAATAEILRQQAVVEWKNYKNKKNGTGEKAKLTKQLHDLDALSADAVRLRAASDAAERM